MFQELNNLLILLCRLIQTRKLYFNKHPKVESLTTDFIVGLKAFCRENDIDKLFLGVADGALVFEGRSLIGPSIVGRQLIEFTVKLQCGGISFTRQTTAEEVRKMLDINIDLKSPLVSLNDARKLFHSHNIKNIELAHEYLVPSIPIPRKKQSVWQGQDTGNFLQSPTLIFQALFDTVAQAYGDVMRGNDIDIDNTRSVGEHILHFVQTGFSDTMQHILYPDYNSYVLGHSVRVTSLAVFVAHMFNWSKELQLSLATAGLLHDIGKSAIPTEIMYKTGTLTREERMTMMDHCRIGAEILISQRDVSPLEISAAWGHHIRYDGSGYPKPPRWAVRHPVTSLIQICDVFEALTARRPHRPPLAPHMSYSIMLEDKGAFDPGLLASFISVLGLYPPGNVVRMSDGSQGVVMATGSAIDRPTVKIISDPSGRESKEGEEKLIDLDAYKRRDLFVEELLVDGVEQ